MNSDAEAHSQQSLIQAQLQEVAAETGYARQTVEWIFANAVTRDPAAPPPEGTRRGLSAEELCDKLIRHANDAHPGDLRLVLESNRILRSEDIGDIVTGLVNKGLLIREEDDYFTDFDDLFDIEHLGAYLARRGIRRRWLDWPGVQRRLSRVLYGLGLAFIAASCLDFVKNPYGWWGWAIVLSGWLISRLPRGRS